MTARLIAALLLLAAGIAIGYATRPDAPAQGYYGRQQWGFIYMTPSLIINGISHS